MMRWWVSREGRRVDVAARQVGERMEVAVDGRTVEVELLPAGAGLFALLCPDGRTFAVVGQRRGQGVWRVTFGQMDFEVHLRDPLEREVEQGRAGRAGAKEVRAPIPGKVVGALVAPGDAVHAGQVVVVLEAMKMENQIAAEADGIVREVRAAPGTAVEGGELLVVLE